MNTCHILLMGSEPSLECAAQSLECMVEGAMCTCLIKFGPLRVTVIIIGEELKVKYVTNYCILSSLATLIKFVAAQQLIIVVNL